MNPLLWLRVATSVLLALLVSSPFASYARAAEVKRPFDLAAGDAAQTLPRFAEQADREIIFSPAAVRGFTTRQVRGDYPAREALHAMLAGTGLVATQDEASGTFAIRQEKALPPAEPPAPKAGPRTSAAPASGAHGSITGRVFDASGGGYVSNARVIIEALQLETFTDEYGAYAFLRVPVGAALVRVSYTGFTAATLALTVQPGQRAAGDVTLRSAQEKTAATDGATVRLDAFTVAARRDMSASDVAVNEQRYTAAIKNVVATDSFGDIAEGNVGEFAKFLPGVTLNRDGSDGRSISLGGVPASGTPVMIDGNPLSSAASSGGSRTIELEQVSITSMSRVEVTRSQTPDSPANAIGGTVNLVSRSAFERRAPEYSVKSYLSFRGGDFSVKKEANPLAKKTYPFEPNLELNAVVPVTPNFGFTASGLMTRALANGQGAITTWVPNGTGISANFPATTPDKPYLVTYRLQERPKLSVRDSASLSADWRVSPHDVLTFGFQYAYFQARFWIRQVNFATGRVSAFGPDFTQGAAGAGTVQIINDQREKDGTTSMPSFRWKHTGPVWQWQINGAYARSSNHYRSVDKGYFNQNNAFLRNVTVRFEQMNYDHPGVVSIRDAANQNAIDPYRLSNYRLESVSGAQADGRDAVRSLSAFLKRDLDLALPLTLKAGADLRAQRRDITSMSVTASHVGADRVAQTVDDRADQWYDPVYSSRTLLFGQKMEWMDLSQIYDLYRTTPARFSQTEANLVTDYRTQVTDSNAVTETIAAPYLRLDSKLLQGRLQFVGGVRYERTADEGDGPLIDTSRIYRRDTSGQLVRDSAGRPIAIAPLATLAGSQLAYFERGARANRTYDGFFPSFSTTYLLRPNLVARATYGRSINRPDFTDIFPRANLPDPAGTSRTITLSNPSLQPWTADSYGVALEYYFDEPSTGVLSTRLYRRDIKNFWGSTLTPATDALLETYGLDPTTYGESLGYMIQTDYNVGKARVSGAEFDYRQNLVFLPHWARGFTVFANLTLQHLEGDQRASFDGFVSKTANWGITFSRARFTTRLAVNLKGTVRQAQINTAGAEPGTFAYLMPRRSADLTAEYRFTRHVSVFVSGRNINEAIDDTVRYGPQTPRDRSLNTRLDYRAYWNVGVKGTF